MGDVSAPSEKRMRLRYPGTCCICGTALPARVEAIYERESKTVRCLGHDAAVGPPLSVEAPVPIEPPPLVDPTAPVELVETHKPVEAGTPGASARREYERRSARREERIRTAHPRLGGLIHALTDDPQSTTAWDVGAVGEERLGNRLNELASDTIRLLHDRRIPRSKANIDHLAVTSTGVWVIDAKKYRGRPHLKVEGGLLRPRVEKLMVGTRNCTSLVDGALKQLGVIREYVEGDIPLHGVLCFVEADWPLFGGAFTTRGVAALPPKKLYPKLQADGALDTASIERMHRALASALPPA